MGSTFTVKDADTTISFSFKAPTATIQKILEDAAEYLWNHGYGNHGDEKTPITFAGLNNNQKLTLVENHLREVVINLANTQKQNKVVETARVDSEKTKYSL